MAIRKHAQQQAAIGIAGSEHAAAAATGHRSLTSLQAESGILFGVLIIVALEAVKLQQRLNLRHKDGVISRRERTGFGALAGGGARAVYGCAVGQQECGTKRQGTCDESGREMAEVHVCEWITNKEKGQRTNCALPR